MVEEIEGLARGAGAYEHFRFGREAGRIAGLKETLALVMNRYMQRGDTRVCLDVADGIRARISQLEKDDG